MDLNFIFKSPDYLKYENNKLISGPHGGAGRVIKVEPERVYEDNFIVTIYNSDGNNPLWQNNVQMAPKQMKIIEKNSNKIVLRGWGQDSMGESYANYGLTINLKNNIVSNCIIHIYDRNVDIKYLNQDDINNTSKDDLISEISQKNKNGIFVENKIDGERIEWTFVNDIKHGEWKMYFSNGKLKEIGNVKKEIPEGSWKAFNVNGTLRAIGQFENGYQIGHWKYNDENGTLRAEGKYIHGQQKGKWIYYDDNGEIEGSEIL